MQLLNWFIFPFPEPVVSTFNLEGHKKQHKRQTAACCHSRAPSRKGTVESTVALILLYAARDTGCWHFEC